MNSDLKNKPKVQRTPLGFQIIGAVLALLVGSEVGILILVRWFPLSKYISYLIGFISFMCTVGFVVWKIAPDYRRTHYLKFAELKRFEKTILVLTVTVLLFICIFLGILLLR